MTDEGKWRHFELAPHDDVSCPGVKTFPASDDPGDDKTLNQIIINFEKSCCHYCRQAGRLIGGFIEGFLALHCIHHFSPLAQRRDWKQPMERERESRHTSTPLLCTPQTEKLFNYRKSSHAVHRQRPRHADSEGPPLPRRMANGNAGHIYLHSLFPPSGGDVRVEYFKFSAK